MASTARTRKRTEREQDDYSKLRSAAERLTPASWFSSQWAANRQFVELMTLAFDGLRNEDAQLSGALTRGKLAAEYRERGAPGLSYWVYEHNLVYPVFKAWALKHRVLWDEAPTAQWKKPFDAATREPPANDTRQQKLIDLQVLLDKSGDERWLFEAQWLNNERGVTHAQQDAVKLHHVRLARGKKPTRLFLLGLWYNYTDSIDEDLEWVRNCPDGTNPAFLGLFPSTVPGKKKGPPVDGYHFVAVFEVTGRPLAAARRR